MSWHALAAARAHDATRRVPFIVDDFVVGSIQRVHLAALRRWPDWLRVEAEAVTWLTAAPLRDAHLATVNEDLRERGLVRGWRDELFAIIDPRSGKHLISTERAAARFWGTLTRGAHATGYVRNAAGVVDRLWIARRSATKSTDPGKFDNLVGGGVPLGQSPWQALVREGWEEAGLEPALMQQAQIGSVVQTRRDVDEGLQWEDLHCFDLELPASLKPHNQDGEVQGFDCLRVAEALALAAGPQMTVDAALVTLDFALRHALFEETSARALRIELDKLISDRIAN